MQPGNFYHVYNRGNNRQRIFFEERNYLYFLRLFEKYLSPLVDVYAYCLMPNHFHLLIRIKDNHQTSEVFKTSEVFGNPDEVPAGFRFGSTPVNVVIPRKPGNPGLRGIMIFY
jgi:hypothetical protein